ncbi:hypothetical protein RhiirA1_447889 [Rhizophagus irregularis]|uniref:Uncharacterized protein n=1 Tax=Rhizophagus irregularis TaxID=588596 RepID=A0A2N0SL22_9GLOM|nr:hypothetical protein RhiirA1_447889 [Rhizophagus irregularis]
MKFEYRKLMIQLDLFNENDEKEKISLNDDNEIETEDINTKVMDLSKIQKNYITFTTFISEFMRHANRK